MIRRIYVLGSLKNPEIPKVAAALRQDGHYVFDDWYAPGEDTDAYWQRYEQSKGSSFVSALNGHAARNNFAFDLRNLHDCDTAVMVMPCGKSGHLELGHMSGRGMSCHILMPAEPEKWDLMYRFANGVWFNVHHLRLAMIEGLCNVQR